MAEIPTPVTSSVIQPIRTTLDLEALDAIAAGLARTTRRVPPSDEQSLLTPRSMRLIDTGDYDVWLITWPPDSGTGVHDHTDSSSVTRVVSGEMTDVVAGTHRLARPGDLIVTPAHTAHELRNAGPHEATTLHVYSPPLTAVTYRSGEQQALPPTTGDYPAFAPTPVRPRQAEATAHLRSAVG